MANMIRSLNSQRAALPRAVTVSLVTLILIGAGSALLYWHGIVEPYGLAANQAARHVTLGTLIGLAPDKDWAYEITLAGLFVLYAGALLLVRRRGERAMWVVVIAGAAVFSAILLLAYPMEAIDIFDYIMHGRVQAVYGADPFAVTPLHFPSDRFFSYGLWNDWTSTYGPLWETAAGLAARLAGDGVVTNVIVFKLIEVAGYAVTCLALVRILQREAPDRALFGLTLFAWNPLTLFSLAGNGHNDGLMLAFVMLGFYFLSIRRFSLAVMAELAGALVKFIPLLILPIVAVAGLKAQTSWKDRLRFIGLTGLGCALLAALAYAPYPHLTDFMAVSRRADLFTTSLPALIHFQLARSIGSQADHLVATAALGLTGLFALWQTWRAWRDTRPDAAPRAALAVFFFYLLVTCLWFQPWYVTWALALAAVVGGEALSWGAVLLSAAGQAQLPLFWLYLYPRITILPPPAGDLAETLSTLGLCWLYFVAIGAWKAGTAALGGLRGENSQAELQA